MATTIPLAPEYSGPIALRSNPLTFPADAESQYTYLAGFSVDWNTTITAMNTAIAETEAFSDSAETNKDLAETAATNAENSATQAAADAGSANGNPLGDYANGLTFNSHNDYVSENGLFRLKDSVSTPYTTNTTTYPLATDDPNLAPWSNVDVLKSIALALNVLREAILNGVAGQQITAQTQYLHNPDDQATWGLPSGVGAGEVIVSVVGDQLETDVSSPSAYTLVNVDTLNRSATMDSIINNPTLKVGHRVVVTDRGGAVFDCVLTSAVTPNTYDIVRSVVSPQLSLVLDFSGSLDLKYLGLKADGTSDDTNVVLYALANYRDIEIPEGTVLITDTLFSPLSVSPTRPDILHGERAGLRFRGAGPNRSIFKMMPNNTIRHGMIFGNYTEEVPSTVYQAAYLDIGGFTILLANDKVMRPFKIREGYNSTASNIRVCVIAEDTLTNNTDWRGVSFDGSLGCTYSGIYVDTHESTDRTGLTGMRVGNSTRLTSDAGSGNGSSTTSTTIKNSYMRLCQFALKDEDSNGCGFDGVTLESSQYGAYVTGPLSSTYKMCYVENNDYPYYVDGSSSQTASGLSILGGYINYASATGAKAGGALTTNGVDQYTRDPYPITAINASNISITDVQMLGTYSLNGFVNVQQGLGTIRMQAQNQGSSIAVAASNDKPITNYNIASGTNLIKLSCAGHGAIIGDLVGVLNSSVGKAGGLVVGAPLMHVVFVNGVNELWVIASTDLTNLATGSAGGSMTGDLRRYVSDTFKVPKVDRPRQVTFTDCTQEVLGYSERITAPPTARRLPLNGVAGAEYYICDTWTYVMHSQRFASVAPVAAVVNYTYVQFIYPDNYSSSPINNLTPDLQGDDIQTTSEIGYLVPPGTKILVELTSSDLTVGGGSNTRTEVVKVYLQRIPNFIESF